MYLGALKGRNHSDLQNSLFCNPSASTKQQKEQARSRPTSDSNVPARANIPTPPASNTEAMHAVLAEAMQTNCFSLTELTSKMNLLIKANLAVEQGLGTRVTWKRPFMKNWKSQENLDMQILNSWKLKFIGSPESVSLEDFIYIEWML